MYSCMYTVHCTQFTGYPQQQSPSYLYMYSVLAVYIQCTVLQLNQTMHVIHSTRLLSEDVFLLVCFPSPSLSFFMYMHTCFACIHIYSSVLTFLHVCTFIIFQSHLSYTPHTCTFATCLYMNITLLCFFPSCVQVISSAALELSGLTQPMATPPTPPSPLVEEVTLRQQKPWQKIVEDRLKQKTRIISKVCTSGRTDLQQTFVPTKNI